MMQNAWLLQVLSPGANQADISFHTAIPNKRTWILTKLNRSGLNPSISWYVDLLNLLLFYTFSNSIIPTVFSFQSRLYYHWIPWASKTWLHFFWLFHRDMSKAQQKKKGYASSWWFDGKCKLRNNRWYLSMLFGVYAGVYIYIYM